MQKEYKNIQIDFNFKPRNEFISNRGGSNSGNNSSGGCGQNCGSGSNCKIALPKKA
jgi:hypothetical protein